ncbi:MAG: RHS repeat-associated core domain-containing protein [Desulfocapsaceae bacterium]|nr:RHS repeat-associated core domain-containing protein [Desulfocapsaceae bacterium]
MIGSRSYAIGYSWDPATGDLAGMTYPSGLELTYIRDANGQVTAINVNDTPLVSAISRLPFGPLKSATQGSVNLSRAYDQRYNVSGIKAGSSFDISYTRDAGGHATSVTGLLAPQVIAYTSDYSYKPTNNQLTGRTGSTPKAYSYDANGNMVSDGTYTFVYDGLNRISQVSQGTSPIASYGYDSSNRRIRKTVGATTTHYLYDLNSRLIAETLLDGTPLREYIYLDGEPIAVKEHQNTPEIYYFINDHLGTPQQLVDASGTVVWQAAYLPFGKAQVTTETITNNLRFPGQYYDSETGLHYNWNRFYDPDTGRYVSTDPIGLWGGMNLYAYASGNPVNWFDPWGLETLVIINGQTPGNPFGHVAIATTGSGLYSPGNNPNDPNLNYTGSSVTSYLADQAMRRDSVAFILPTSPNQENAIISYMQEKTTKPDAFPDNCAGRVSDALKAGNINLTDPFRGFSLPTTPFPRSLYRALQNLESHGGATSLYIPQNGIISPTLNSFNPQ